MYGVTKLRLGQSDDFVCLLVRIDEETPVSYKGEVLRPEASSGSTIHWYKHDVVLYEVYEEARYRYESFLREYSAYLQEKNYLRTRLEDIANAMMDEWG